MRRIGVGLLMCGGAILQAKTGALAADPLGFYGGGAWGLASVPYDKILFASPFAVPQSYEFDEHHTAWKIIVGVHPIPTLGVELEYIDFGHPSVQSEFLGLPLRADAQIKGPAVFAVGYLPLPIPLLDIYGKVGLAHLQTTVNATNVGHYLCPSDSPCVISNLTWIAGVYHLNPTDSSVAYGAGVQVKLSALAVRLEYERVNETGGDPDLVSLGATWIF